MAIDDCVVCREVRGDIEVPGGPLQSGDVALAFHIPRSMEPTSTSAISWSCRSVTPRTSVISTSVKRPRSASS